MKTAVITVVTNESYNLELFYKAFSEQTNTAFTIYFVDNNSSDGSTGKFKLLNSGNKLNVTYIKLDYNAGFSGGTNIAAEAAIRDGSDFIFIVNNDVYPEPSCIMELQKLVLTDDSIAAAGPLLCGHIHKHPRKIQEFGGKINFKRGTVEKYFANIILDDIVIPETLETNFIGGGVCFIRSSVFSKTGMFNNDYFAYFDEIDLSYRLTVLNNYKMFVTSKAVVYHNHNWTKKNKNSYYFEYYLSERNKFLFFKKYKLHLSTITVLVIDIIKFPWRLIWFIKVCGLNLGFYYLLGMFHGLFGNKGKPPFKFVN